MHYKCTNNRVFVYMLDPPHYSIKYDLSQRLPMQPNRRRETPNYTPLYELCFLFWHELKEVFSFGTSLEKLSFYYERSKMLTFGTRIAKYSYFVFGTSVAKGSLFVRV